MPTPAREIFLDVSMFVMLLINRLRIGIISDVPPASERLSEVFRVFEAVLGNGMSIGSGS